MRLSAPQSVPAIAFSTLRLRVHLDEMSLMCALKVSLLSRVTPRYLKIFTVGIIWPCNCVRMRGLICLGCFENVIVADFVGAITTPHRLHQEFTSLRAI